MGVLNRFLEMAIGGAVRPGAVVGMMIPASPLSHGPSRRLRAAQVKRMRRKWKVPNKRASGRAPYFVGRTPMVAGCQALVLVGSPTEGGDVNGDLTSSPSPESAGKPLEHGKKRADHV
jgi:hypothetical protein